MPDLLTVESTNNRAHKWEGFSDTPLDSFATTGVIIPRSITWDGANAIVGNLIFKQVKQYTGFTDTVLASFTSTESGNNASGCKWVSDSQFFVSWASVNDVYDYDGFTDSINSTLSYAASLQGCSWDGTDLMTTRSAGAVDIIERFDGFSTSINNSFRSPDANPASLDWDGTNVIHIGGASDLVIKFDGFTDCIESTHSTITVGTTGIAWQIIPSTGALRGMIGSGIIPFVR